MKFRWNTERGVWEFYEPAWGGWCVLRETPAELSRPMDYEQGMVHIAERLVIAETRGTPCPKVVRFDDTRADPSRLSGLPGTGNPNRPGDPAEPAVGAP